MASLLLTGFSLSPPHCVEDQFDFVVVGGGTAGNVVANRLSENSTFNVLVLEAGGSNAGVLDIIVPFYAPRATPDTAQDWNYTTTSSRFEWSYRYLQSGIRSRRIELR
ncbi:hypothetical protein B0H12DRAFT_1074375, partial [Mycena haematopus]